MQKDITLKLKTKFIENQRIVGKSIQEKDFFQWKTRLLERKLYVHLLKLSCNQRGNLVQY